METADAVYIAEVKSHRDMRDEDVLMKAKAAHKYCEHVNAFAAKKWRYVLFEDSMIKRSSTFAGLVRESEKYAVM